MSEGSLPLRVSFSGASKGEWRVKQISALRGDALAAQNFVAVAEGRATPPQGAAWTLSGYTSNLRYTTAQERDGLAAIQAPLGRTNARNAALIPIRKSAAWWNLAQDERREIFEDSSRHIAIGLEYLPAVARRLHHCRDVGEPFDFLTWFEFAPGAEAAFDAMVARLRATEEWRYVDREVDIRLVRSQDVEDGQ